MAQLPPQSLARKILVHYWRSAIAAALFVLVLLLPMPSSVRQVAAEYTVGKHIVARYFTQALYNTTPDSALAWQETVAEALTGLTRQGALTREVALKRGRRQLGGMGIPMSAGEYDRFRDFVLSMDPDAFHDLMRGARDLWASPIDLAALTPEESEQVAGAARQIHISLALVVFVVFSFLSEAMPLPAVAFIIGIITVFGGIVTQREVASLYWSDASWFIMGSLMIAAAFIKTGLDKHITLALFKGLAKPDIRWITAVLILVIAPTSAVFSNHMLAAIFLPIGLILYNNSLTAKVPEDGELAKMIMITIAMACNIGGFGAPSGGARNVIIMNYLEDMFGYSISYQQWIIYAFPFVLVMMVVLWVAINLQFKPRIRDLTPALERLKSDLSRKNRWTKKQLLSLVIFMVVMFGWLTESSLLERLLGVRLGIGVIAVLGGILFLVSGVVTWKDYQEKVDWGVVWLYAGAILFGRILDQTGTATWMARSVVVGLADLGLHSGFAILSTGSLVTAGMTNLLAAGPTAASLAPITLNMAAAHAPGTTLVPFMGLATAAASAFAYLLVIGTPPNAIVYSSGHLRAVDFLRVGVISLVASMVTLLLMSLVYWPMLGFNGLPAAP